jgi:hypothetical protein
MPILSLIPVYFILALLLPIIWVVGRAYWKSQGRRQVTCPETEQFAVIELDAKHAAFMHVLGNLNRRVQGCSRWPQRRACSQECLKQIGAAA